MTDYLGTPIQMYDEKGEKTWECELDVYGKVRNFTGSSIGDSVKYFREHNNIEAYDRPESRAKADELNKPKHH